MNSRSGNLAKPLGAYVSSVETRHEIPIGTSDASHGDIGAIPTAAGNRQ